ncbi:MAG: hypothetical protein F4074_03070 [Synechococcus sp. SB0672_bin_10]|nr:hypothetical protein [Synechococcus sp. SB0672_bin_10]
MHQLERIKPFFPQPPGVRRVDHKVVSGSIYVHVTAGTLVDTQPPMDPTKPSTTVSVAGGIRVSSP